LVAWVSAKNDEDGGSFAGFCRKLHSRPISPTDFD
jgi:hypothetical protein